MRLSKDLISETENQLQRLQFRLMKGRPSCFEELSPLTIDTIRGWAWEHKNRGKLFDYLKANPLLFIKSVPGLVHRAANLGGLEFSSLDQRKN